MPARDKHSSILQTHVNYGREKFYNNGLSQPYKIMSNFTDAFCNVDHLSNNMIKWPSLLKDRVNLHQKFYRKAPRSFLIGHQ
jgi:hypothetical protein